MNVKERRKAYDAVREALDEPYGVRGDGAVSRKAIVDAQEALNRIAYNHGWVQGERDHWRTRALKAEKWLGFIADTQHKLLAEIHIELSDKEWDAFADAIGIPRTRESEDGTGPVAE